jgi:hypothetical protein
LQANNRQGIDADGPPVEKEPIFVGSDMVTVLPFGYGDFLPQLVKAHLSLHADTWPTNVVMLCYQKAAKRFNRLGRPPHPARVAAALRES